VIVPPVVAPAPTPPVVAPAPAAVELLFQIVSSPAGANVRDAANGALLGTTPLRLQRPTAAGSFKITVSKAGWKPALVEMPADTGGERRVALERVVNPHVAQPPQTPATTPAVVPTKVHLPQPAQEQDKKSSGKQDWRKL
jgi:hypothetical protein